MIIAVWITIVGFVGFAVYRQVRAHMELHRSLHVLEDSHRVLMNRLNMAVDSLEGISAEEPQVLERPILPTEEWRSVVRQLVGETCYAWLVPPHELTPVVAFSLLQSEIEMRHGCARFYEKQHLIRSPEDRVRSWLEQEHVDAWAPVPA